jgi:hypothetical protein
MASGRSTNKLDQIDHEHDQRLALAGALRPHSVPRPAEVRGAYEIRDTSHAPGAPRVDAHSHAAAVENAATPQAS